MPQVQKREEIHGQPRQESVQVLLLPDWRRGCRVVSDEYRRIRLYRCVGIPCQEVLCAAGPPSGQTGLETGSEDEEGKQGCQRAGYGFLLRPNAGRSGLTFEDVTASVYKTDDTKSVFQCRTFKPGTIDERGMLTAKGDDVIIEYYDLDAFLSVMSRRITSAGRPGR